MDHKLLKVWHEKSKTSLVQSEGTKEGDRFTSALDTELQVNAKSLKSMLTSAKCDKILSEAENEATFNVFGVMCY